MEEPGGYRGHNLKVLAVLHRDEQARQNEGVGSIHRKVEDPTHLEGELKLRFVRSFHPTVEAHPVRQIFCIDCRELHGSPSCCRL